MDPLFKVLWMIFYWGLIIFVLIMLVGGSGGGNGEDKK